MSWIKLTHVNKLEEKEGQVFEIGDLQVALFKINGNYYAVDNLCPHMAGPLSLGNVEDLKVVCPWHGWKFDLTTGQSPENPSACVDIFNIKIEDNEIYVEVNS